MQDFGCWIDAAFAEGHWDAALDQSKRALGARFTALARRIGASQTLAAVTSTGAPASFAGACAQIANDPRAPLAGEAAFDQRSTLFWSRMRGEIGEEGYLAAFFAVIENPRDRTSFDAIAAVVRSAVLAHARVAKLTSASALKDIALDQSPWGTAIIDHGLAVHEMNEACDGVLKRADGLSLLGGRLLCRRGEDQAALARAVAGAVNVSPTAAAGAVVCIRRASGAPPYVARPLGPKADAMASGKCLLMIVDPDQAPRSAEEIWRAMFDLTECELIIAEGLVSGRRINDIADQRGVSVETVRSQTKSMFERLQVTSQTQAAVLLSSSAPFRPASPTGQDVAQARQRKAIA